MNNDEFIMRRCLELAKKGAGYVSPNPLVGCVIVKDGKIAAESFHRRFGQAHAEVNAIRLALRRGIKLRGASLYVNLEPCFHYGKTPPCVDEIIKHNFAEVIIGCNDPNPLVSGKSMRKLRKNGVAVSSGVLEKDCRWLNKFFIKYITTGFPYVTIKAAQTLDGLIARKDFSSKWISSIASRKLVHKLRSECDAVLVGSRTVKYDDPNLTVRLVKGRNPIRIVIDGKLTLGTNYRIFKSASRQKTILLTGKIRNKSLAEKLIRKSVIVVECRERGSSLDLRDALKKLCKIGIASIMAEGGAETYNHFLEQNLADEILLFVAPKVFGNGVRAFKNEHDFSDSIRSVQKTGSDVLFKFQLKEY